VKHTVLDAANQNAIQTETGYDRTECFRDIRSFISEVKLVPRTVVTRDQTNEKDRLPILI
jgi:hypothetical protein